MSGHRHPPRSCAALLLAALAIGGCSNPDAPAPGHDTAEQAQIASPGEPSPPPPAAPSSLTAAEVKRTPAQALTSFAALYVNWSYRDLTVKQRTLAAISLGSARTAEQQAAASSAGDATLAAAHLSNSGTIVSIASDQARRGLWVIVTQEQTSGSGDYEGLPAAYHVTLARLAALPGGYAVSEWLPQS